MFLVSKKIASSQAIPIQKQRILTAKVSWLPKNNGCAKVLVSQQKDLTELLICIIYIVTKHSSYLTSVREWSSNCIPLLTGYVPAVCPLVSLQSCLLSFLQCSPCQARLQQPFGTTEKQRFAQNKTQTFICNKQCNILFYYIKNFQIKLFTIEG